MDTATTDIVHRAGASKIDGCGTVAGSDTQSRSLVEISFLPYFPFTFHKCAADERVYHSSKEHVGCII